MDGLQEASLFHICSEMGIMTPKRFKKSFESRRRLSGRMPGQLYKPNRTHEWPLLGETVMNSWDTTEDVARIVFLLSLFLTIIAWLLGIELPPVGRPL